jgi:hypothetical protein
MNKTDDVKSFLEGVAQQQADALFVLGAATAAIRLMVDFAMAHKENNNEQLQAALQLFSLNMARLVETRDPNQSMDAVDRTGRRLGIQMPEWHAERATTIQ